MPATDLFLATPGRQRMSALAACAALFAISNSAFDMVAPLWATSDLGLDAAGWAHLRALRFTGTVVGILALGVLAERVGSRRMAALTLALGGCALACMGLGLPWLVALCMPLFGALVSTTFVNLNALTQQVSRQRQGLANSIYRSIAAGMAVIAPLAATALAGCFGAWSPVLHLAAFATALGGLFILLYPEERGDGRSLRAVLRGFADTARNRGLWRFIVLDQAMAFSQGAFAAFAALRLTRQMGLGETAFGLVCTLGACLGLVAVLAAGLLVQRIPLAWGMATAWVLSATGSLLLGVGDHVAFGIAGTLLVAFGWPITSVPGSMWISLAGGANATAFTVHKIVQAGVAAAAMALVARLEPLTGMRPLLIAGGVIGLPLAMLILRQRDPRRPAD